MERRFRVRLDELLDDAVVPPAVPLGMLPRLHQFLEPFLATLDTSQQRTHARHYAAGLVSDLGRKNAEGIAYLHDQERQGLQKFLGQAEWQERPLLTELARQVGNQLGEPDGGSHGHWVTSRNHFDSHTLLPNFTIKNKREE